MSGTAVVSGSVELVATVPHLLGFVPSPGDVVVVLIDAPGRVRLAARVDAAEILDEAPRSEDVCGLMVIAGMRVGAAGAFVIGYDGPQSPGETEGSVAAMADRLAREGIPALGSVQVCGSAWREDPSAPWWPLPDTTPAAVAERVAQGSAPAGSRDELRNRLLAGPAVSRVLGQRRAAQAWPWERQAAALAQCLGTDAPARPRVLAGAASAFAGVVERDVLVGVLLPGLMPLDSLPAGLVAVAEAALSEVAQLPVQELAGRAVRLAASVPVSMSTGPLLLAAMLSWAAGDGATAGDAVSLVRQRDSGNRLAQLISMGLSCGMPYPRAGAGGAR